MSSQMESYSTLTNFDPILCFQYLLLIFLRIVYVYIVYFNHTQTHVPPPLTFPRYPQTCFLILHLHVFFISSLFKKNNSLSPVSAACMCMAVGSSTKAGETYPCLRSQRK